MLDIDHDYRIFPKRIRLGHHKDAARFRPVEQEEAFTHPRTQLGKVLAIRLVKVIQLITRLNPFSRSSLVIEISKFSSRNLIQSARRKRALLNGSKPAQRFKPAGVKSQPALEAGR